jgi:cell division protein FtsW
LIRYCSIVLCLAVGLLVTLGLVMVSSTGAWVYQNDGPYTFVRKQAFMAIIGVIGAIIAARFPEKIIRKYWPWALAAVCVMLALCFVPGIGIEEFGSKRWIRLGIRFQPSELARVVGIIALAGWFARWQTEVHTFWRGFVLPGILIGLPIGLIAMETDVGSAMSMSVACAALFFCAGSRLRYLVPTIVAGASAAWIFIRYDAVRWARVEAWMDMDNPIYQLGVNRQQWRALIAFGNGGPTGVGLGNGSEKFGSLTFAHIDFIFAEIGEELGLPFTLGVVLCYVLIAVCGIGIASHANTVFSRLLAIGLTCMIVVPAMQNIAVTTACMPNDGLPLPFVSYGGTSMVLSLVAVGLLAGIHRRSSPRDPVDAVFEQNRRDAIRL